MEEILCFPLYIDGFVSNVYLILKFIKGSNDNLLCDYEYLYTCKVWVNALET